jgi:hypothetical protein
MEDLTDDGRTTMLGGCDFAVAFSSDELSQQSLQQLECMSQLKQELAAVDAIKHRKTLEWFQQSQMPRIRFKPTSRPKGTVSSERWVLGLDAAIGVSSRMIVRASQAEL